MERRAAQTEEVYARISARPRSFEALLLRRVMDGAMKPMMIRRTASQRAEVFS